MATKIYLKLSVNSVSEVSPSEHERKSARLWYQGDGFDVHVIGTLKSSNQSRQTVAHAALTAVQAAGGKVRHLRDINAGKRNTGRSDSELKRAKEMTRDMFDGE